MTAPVNLNRVRKQKAREDARRQADLNAAAYGRTATERAAQAAERAAQAARLDGHRRDE
ncbi:hypothetical protein OCGS_2029 [Oceaniovalibus guishaninsula JLT2003]|uniref:Uncharacterized protein n=1 Tax=Oceaniovalibus guishaninsula JLT2003 TaxID=1231392 RepID=K2H8Z4_9RHOB|nr:DUF4169 family protein [Oceaniovalibus guishaninsula]EKE44048.1 hypothetical protein OCGS_2029 [Oceaniovalibus guishaninsula JLT2003]